MKTKVEQKIALYKEALKAINTIDWDDVKKQSEINEYAHICFEDDKWKVDYFEVGSEQYKNDIFYPQYPCKDLTRETLKDCLEYIIG